MKQPILKSFVLSLFIAASLTVFIESSHAWNSRSRNSAAPAPQEKTVEQVEKNIKVLNGMPASQLIPVMNYFAASMGVRCNYCHVNKNGQWDYASDEKEEKETARAMVKLVLDVNKNTFHGNPQVSCFTCHRGNRSPVSAPPLPLPVPSPRPQTQSTSPATPGGAPGAAPQASPSPRPAGPTADDILNKYITAIGGQSAIDKMKSRVMKGSIATANGLTGTYELDQTAPDKGYEVFVTSRGTMERVVNGSGAWEKNQQGVRELSGQQLSDSKQSMLLFRNLKLKEQYARFRGPRRDRIGDRDVYILEGTTSDNRRERLAFDAESGLLLRRITYLQTMIGIIPEQTDFEDYRDVDGLKLPFLVRVSSVDAGNPFITRKLDDIKLNIPIDDTRFNPPSAPKANP
jgi:photosynthetic reaction center cytochrome c subunit